MEKGLERMTNRGSAELPKRDRPPVWSRLTVRGWVVLVLGLMIAWVIVASIVGARSLGRTAEVSNYLRDVIQPAEIEAQRLQGALLNQETGARGYIIAADPSLLEPYEAGRKEETRASDALRALIAQQEAVPASGNSYSPISMRSTTRRTNGAGCTHFHWWTSSYRGSHAPSMLPLSKQAGWRSTGCEICSRSSESTSRKRGMMRLLHSTTPVSQEIACSRR